MRILTGDCLDILPTLDAASVDACVTDPPYGLSFMGKDWDHGVPGEAYWREVGRVLKPGGHLLAFGGTRTHHRLMVAIEDAGFEIRDCLMWLYGSGFPKSLDVSKAIDKAAGADREVVSEGRPLRRMIPGADQDRTGSWIKNNGRTFTPQETTPATESAQQWAGWGTALKPAWEPIILARKPLAGTVAANVLAHGTGALNVDGCRIGSETMVSRGMSSLGVMHDDAWKPRDIVTSAAGRWPANVVLSHEPECQEVGTKKVKTGTAHRKNSGGKTFGGDNLKPPMPDISYADPDGTETVTAWECTETCAVRLLDEQSGERKTTGTYTRSVAVTNAIYGRGRSDAPVGGIQTGYSDIGGASRFLYTAKASRSERGAYNDHATVKPLALMRWLVRLVTPSGGLVLDPFLGSGTTALACQREGFDCIGIERDEHSAEIAVRRLSEGADMFTDATVTA